MWLRGSDGATLRREVGVGSEITGSRLSGTRYVVCQQLCTIRQDFEMFEATGAEFMSVHGNKIFFVDILTHERER